MLFTESLFSALANVMISFLSKGKEVNSWRYEGHISMAYLIFLRIFKFNITLINRIVSIFINLWNLIFSNVMENKVKE